MKSRTQAWEVGNVFQIPLGDGTSVGGQVVGYEAQVLNSVSIAVFDVRTSNDSLAELPVEKLIAVLFTTRDMLDSGGWKVAGALPISISREQLPFESTRSNGFIGAKVIGSANVSKFAKAFYGLLPWELFADPDYFDKLLVRGVKRPAGM